jgi:hypothetical protein
LKKQGNNQQSQRGNNQRRNNPNGSRNGQNNNNGNNNPNRNAGRGKKPHEPHLWASSASSSTTLTSHLSMVNRRNQDNVGKNSSSNNETGRSNGKSRPKSGYRKNGRTRDASQKQNYKRHYNKPNLVNKKLSPSEAENTSNTFRKGSKNGYNEILKSKTNTFGIDPFELFCAYHLGISSQNQYRPANINQVANRFKIDIGTTRQILKEYGMDSASLLDRDFDMALAQLDIQVAPEGVNRTELGKNIFEDFLEAPIKKRDWKKILEDDRKENAKTFS